MLQEPVLLSNISEKISAIDAIANALPGVVIIHNLTDFTIEYMCNKGLRELGISLEEVKSLTWQQYHDRYFNPDDAEEYVPRIRELIKRNTDENLTFFQQVRTSADGEWVWHMSSMKILMRDEEGLPLLTITTAVPVDPMQHITAKVSRLLEENTFLRKHYPEFSRLGKRECDVLKQIALGKTAAEIADELFIAPTTVETHRKNIKNKLNTNSSYKLSLYARAFDLICYALVSAVTLLCSAGNFEI
jgi:DNA-binding NarL/FixJ family response regulator